MKNGEDMESWVVSIVIAVIGWLIALFGYIYHQGQRSQETKGMARRIDDLEGTVERDEQLFSEGMDILRKEIKEEIRRLFFDGDGNSRVMTKDTCELSRINCSGKFEYLTKDLKKSSENQVQRDHEIFGRVRGIEEKIEELGKNIVGIATSLKMLQTRPRSLDKSSRPVINDGD